ncbi:unnamed protein product [Arabis nemorensis]|uniref:rhomboid protease n=1 Tax=Arabis nemorensis TaxID=586526 RepID=A0A565B8T7_9BRAS|nr:unnamed protein product [Arabis nemorensis]
MLKNTWILNFSLFILQIFTSSKALDVTQYGAIGDGVTDDSQAFLRAWEAVCSGIGDEKLIVPAGMTFMLQPLKFQGSCKSTPIFVQILGNLVASSRGKWKGDKDQWILFADIEGLVVEGNGEINGQGSSWWEHSSRPTALKFKSCNNLRLSGLTHIDSPMAHIHINGCNGVTISNLRINAPESSPNTDGIDIAASTNVIIQDCVIGTGDDCIAINSGTANIRISGIDCGPGHGISIGSLGKDGETASVENVCVQNCNFRGTTNGARIKTWPGGSGYARMITFHGITLDNVENPIIIDQHYNGGDSDKTKDDKSSAVEVSKVVYSNFVGTSKSEYGVDFRCSERVPCTEIFMRDVRIETASSGSGQVAQGQCLNVRGVSTLAVPGLECLALSTDMFSVPESSEQTCMLPQSVQPNTLPIQQEPLWVYASGGKRLRVYNASQFCRMAKRPQILPDIENGPPLQRPEFLLPIPEPWYAWLVPLILVANFVTFVSTMYVNDCPSRSKDCVLFNILGRLSFQPLKENLLLGPSLSTLRKLGALEKRRVQAGDKWRIVSCIWLHGGLLHLIVNMISLLCIGMRLEQEFGFLRIGTLYMISGIGGSIVSCLMDIRGERISVGASGALFGLLGAMLSELITNWSIYEDKCTSLMTLILITLLNVTVGFLPHVDDSAHGGGFLAGFFLGFVLLLRPQYGYVSSKCIPPGFIVKHKKSKHKCYQHFLRFLSVAILLAGSPMRPITAVRMSIIEEWQQKKKGYKNCRGRHTAVFLPSTVVYHRSKEKGP